MLCHCQTPFHGRQLRLPMPLVLNPNARNTSRQTRSQIPSTQPIWKTSSAGRHCHCKAATAIASTTAPVLRFQTSVVTNDAIDQEDWNGSQSSIFPWFPGVSPETPEEKHQESIKNPSKIVPPVPMDLTPNSAQPRKGRSPLALVVAQGPEGSVLEGHAIHGAVALVVGPSRWPCVFCQGW